MSDQPSGNDRPSPSDYVRPADDPVPEQKPLTGLARLLFRLRHPLADLDPERQRYADGRVPMLGFPGGVRQQVDQQRTDPD